MKAALKMNTQRPARTLYPHPQQIKWSEGTLSLGGPVTLHLSVNSDYAGFFKKTWDNLTCQKIPLAVNEVSTHIENGFSLEVTGLPPRPHLEEKSTYAMIVNALGVSASAVDEVSLRQAWLSLLQMLASKPGTREIEGFQLPYFEIQDYPLMKFRSAHLCVFPETTLSALEKSIHLLGMNKFSHVVIEFWGMLQLETLSELAWPQAYTKNEIEPLLQRARDLGMQPIPMFNHWGHATASREKNGRHVVLDQNPLLAPLFEPDGWTWCLTNPQSLKILAGVRRELTELFGDIDYFHVGCDEAYSHATCDSCRQEDPVVLLAEYLNVVNDDLKSYGLRPLIWGDALLDHSKFEGYLANSQANQKTHETLALLSKDFIIVDWQYGVKDKKQSATVRHFQGQGFEVVTAPWYDDRNILASGEIALEEKIFGMMLTTWHTLPVTMRILPVAGTLMWGGPDAAKDHPAYRECAMTSQATFIRRIRKGPVVYSEAGWRSFEVTELFD